jgi:hypothetical protein
LTKPHVDSSPLWDSKSAQSAFQMISGALTHPDFRFDRQCVLRIRNQFARSDESQFRVLEVARFLLPPTSLYSNSSLIIERPQLAAYCVLAAECFYRQLTSISKSSLDNTVFIPTVLAKFFEFCWLEGFYDPTTVTSEVVHRLAITLAEGGWAAALRINQRLSDFVQSTPKEKLQELIKVKNNRNKKTLKVKDIISSLGTNLSSKEMQPSLRIVFNALGIDSPTENRTVRRPTKTMLKQYLDPLNLLSRLPEPYAFKTPLVPNPWRTANRVGREGSRTRNLSVDNVASLLSRALLWVDQVGPHICVRMAEFASDVASRKSRGQKWLGLGASRIFTSLYEDIEKILGEEVIEFRDLKDGKKPSRSVNNLILCFQVACFVLIAAMNARRRDEVSGRKIGLHRYSLEEVDAELGVYQVQFYLEKTYRDYMAFYVNNSTARAILLLQRLYDSYAVVDACNDSPNRNLAPEEETLFSYRTINVRSGFGSDRLWFSIDDAVRTGKFAVFRGADVPEKFNAHTLRRFYAIFYYYRYENGTLHSLMYQLGHVNLGSVLTYVTDPKGRPETEKIAYALNSHSRDRKAAFEKHCEEIEVSLREVGAEKIRDNVERALRGEAVGGYAKYLRRLDVKLATITQFKQTVDPDRADIIAKRVTEAGHWPTPMPHGDCMAGGQAAWRLAHCADRAAQKLQIERAGPLTCHKCAWHQSNSGNIRNLEDELAALERNVLVEKDIIAQIRASREVENLKRVLALYRTRLADMAGCCGSRQ